MRSILKRLASKSSLSKHARRLRRTFRPRVEILEERVTPDNNNLLGPVEPHEFRELLKFGNVYRPGDDLSLVQQFHKPDVAVINSPPSDNSVQDESDPGFPGPLATTRRFYTFGDSVFRPADPRYPAVFPIELTAEVTSPTDLSGGPRPLLLFLHGRHATCFAGASAFLEWPCSAGRSSIPSFQGYQYVGDVLASRGYIVVSISANGINARDNATFDFGMIARGELVQRQLDIWRDLSTGGGVVSPFGVAPFGNTFVGKVDLQNVGTMGHSRGGEGVVRHFVINQSMGSPYDIDAVFPLAPVDFNRPVANNVPLEVLLPYHDGDVADLQGVRFFDDARYNVPGDTAPKHTVEVLGAPHNFYNTIWTPGLFPAGTSDDGASTGQPIVEPPTAAATGSRLNAARVRGTGLAYMSAFFRTYVGNTTVPAQTQFFSFLTGDQSPPPSAAVAPDRIFAAYHPPDKAAARLDVNRLTSAANLTTNTLGGAVTQNLPDYTFGATFQGLQALRLGWNNTSAFWQNNLAAAGGRDVSNHFALQFRVSVPVDPRNAGAQDLRITLTDGAGNSASTTVGAQYPTPGRATPLFIPPPNNRGRKPVLNDVRIPLAAFTGVNLADVRSVRFNFDQRPTGFLFLSDLMFANKSLGFAVINSDPADGGFVSTPSTTFRINLSDAVVAATVQAGDLTVNGIAASSVIINNPTTLTFTYASSPVTAQGLQTMAIAAGAMRRQSDNDPLEPFAASFRFDAVRMQLTANPPSGSSVEIPRSTLIIDINSNEPIAPGSVGLNDLTVDQGTVTAFMIIGPQQVSYTVDISAITAEGVMNFAIASGAYSDAFGNPNLPLAGSYVLDFGEVALREFTAKAPLGSLIYDPPQAGTIAPAGDTDAFLFNLDGQQLVTVVIDPAATLRPTIELVGPGSFSLGAATSAANGLDAVLQTIALPGPGAYRVVVSGAGSTTGGYTLHVILNAAVELEKHNGPANNTPDTAQDIHPSLITLDGPGSRGAVLGRADPANAPDWYSFLLNEGDTATLAVTAVTAGAHTVLLVDPDGNNAALGAPGPTNVGQVIRDFLATADGTYFAVVTGTANTDYSLLITRNASFDTEPNNTLATAQNLVPPQPVLGFAGLQPLGRLLAVSGAAFTASRLFELNPANGAVVQNIGATGRSHITGIDTHPTTGEIFAVSNSPRQLLKINPTTGMATVVGPTNAQIPDISFRSDGTLFAWVEFGAGGSDDLATINLTTGAVTIIPSPIGSFRTGIAFDSADNLFVKTNTLFRVNPATGAIISAVALSTTPHNVLEFGSGDVLFTATRSSPFGPSTLQTINVNTGQVTNLGVTPGVGVSGLAFAPFDDIDTYSFSVNAGDSLVLQTSTPAEGPGEFVNNLDPRLELFNPAGALVAGDDNGAPDGRNARISHIAASSGNYRVRVAAASTTPGEYVLNVDGATGTARPDFRVAATVPANGTRVRGETTRITVDFNDAVLLTSLEAADLTVNGVPAAGFVVVDADTVRFTFPPLGQGDQDVAIAAGAILDVQGTPVQAFAMRFFNDNPPRVISSSIQEGDVLAMSGPTGNLTYVVRFNEPMRRTNLDASDFSLVGFSGAKAPASFSYNAIGDELTINYVNLPDDRYTLTLLSGNGRFEDDAPGDGVNLDGETVVGGVPVWPIPPGRSGNGVEGGNFVVNFFLDIEAVAYPTPLAAKLPLGSLIYDPSVNAAIASLGDTDSFTLNLDAGQTITVLVDPGPSLRPTIELADPSSSVIGSAAGTVNGNDVVLQTVAVTTPGTYTITVGGAAGTTGAYTVQVVLNAALESERHDGPANNSRPTAQDLDPSFLVLQTPSALAFAERGAVLGTIEPGAGVLPNEIEPNNTLATANGAIANFAAFVSNLFHMGIKGNVNPAGDNDWYNIGQLQAGDIITITESGSGSSRGSNPDTFVDLFRGAASAPIFVTGDDDAGPGLDSIIFRFTVTTTDTYFINAHGFAGTPGTYDLALFLENVGTAPTTGGTFTTEVEPNGSAATANNASTSWRAVQFRSLTNGAITAGDVDFFRFQFTAGDLVSVNIDSTSALDARVNLRNAAGTIIASENGTSFGPGADSPVNGFIIPATGTYFVEVAANFGTGTYQAQMYLSTTTPPPVPAGSEDFYKFSAADGNIVTLALKSLTGGALSLQLQDGAGATLATGASGAANLDRVISNFAVPAGGTYFARVMGAAGTEYSLVVMRNAAFDTEPNDTSAAAQDYTGTVGALGALATPTDVDWYRVSAVAGETLVFETMTPGDGPGQFVNILNPRIDLFDPDGNPVGDREILADGRNERITLTVPDGPGGIYRVRVTAEGGTRGEYFLDPFAVARGTAATLGGTPAQAAATAPALAAAVLASQREVAVRDGNPGAAAMPPAAMFISPTSPAPALVRPLSLPAAALLAAVCRCGEGDVFLYEQSDGEQAQRPVGSLDSTPAQRLTPAEPVPGGSLWRGLCDALFAQPSSEPESGAAPITDVPEEPASPDPLVAAAVFAVALAGAWRPRSQDRDACKRRPVLR